MISRRLPCLLLMLAQWILLAAYAGAAADEPIAKTPTADLSQSAGLSGDRRLEAQLTQARSHIAAGEFAPAIDKLQRILDSDVDAFLPTDDAIIALRFAANRMLADLPNSAQAEYRQQFAALAQRGLDTIDPDAVEHDLAQLAVRYRHTYAGVEAMRRLAIRHFDHGRFRLATIGDQQLLNHPLLDEPTRRNSLKRLAIALVVQQDWMQTRALLAANGPLLESVFIQTGLSHDAGREVRLSTWIETQLKQAERHHGEDSRPSPLRFASERQNFAGATTDRPIYLNRSMSNHFVHSIVRENAANDANSTEPLARPSMLSVWEHGLAASNELAEMTETGYSELREHGIPRISSLMPLVVGDLAIIRTIDRLAAFQIETGALVWEHASGVRAGAAVENTELFNNSAFREFTTDALVRQLQSDTVLSSMSTDGTRLFVIEQTGGSDPARFAVDTKPGDTTNDAPTAHNQLVAYNAEDGREEWRSNISPDADNVLQGVFFLGAPAPIERSLYGVGQLGTEIRLFALAADTGAVEWSIRLAEAVEELGQDSSRREQACPVTLSRGLLLCPTTAGVLVAVDPFTRTIRWAYRYSRDDIPEQRETQRGRWNRRSRNVWWERWRRTTLLTDEQHVILASPESAWLHCLEVVDGKPVWKQPRDTGLLVGGIRGDTILCIEEQGIRARKTATGEADWFCETGHPSGSGFASENYYYLPLAEGGVAAIHLQNGQLSRNVPADRLPGGNLAVAPDGVLSQSHGQLVLHPWMHQAETQLLDRPAKGDESSTAAAALSATAVRALLLRERGEYLAAIKLLQATLSEGSGRPEKRRLFETLLAAVERQPALLPLVTGDVTRNVIEEPAALFDGPSDQAVWLQRLANAQRQVGQPRAALATYLELLALKPEGENLVAGSPPRLVRYDRQLQGEIEDLLTTRGKPSGVIPNGINPNGVDSALGDPASGDPAASIRRELHEQMQDRYAHLRDGADVFARELFSEQLSLLPWGLMARTEWASRSGLGVHFHKAQLALLEIAGSDRRELAANALLELGKLMSARSDYREAAWAYRQLRDEFPEVEIAGQGKPAEIIANLSSGTVLTRAIESGPQDVWPAKVPTVSVERTDDRDQSDLFLVPVEAAHGSLFDHLNVSLDLEGRLVRFQEDRHPGYWDLKLPASQSPFRTAFVLHRGWGIGHLLVLRVGSELYGVAPFNDIGEAEARLVWTINTRSQPTWDYYDIRPDRLGFGAGEVVLLDWYGKTIGQVGPVRPGYFCYRHKGTLIAVETATGKQLWQRFELPADCTIQGDDSRLLIRHGAGRDVEVVGVSDGKTIHKYASQIAKDEVLFHSGRYAITLSALESSVRLAKFDGADDRLCWQREFPIDSLPFEIDADALGMIEPSGRLHVVEVSSGKSIQESLTSLPKKIVELHTILDPYRFFLVVSGPLERRVIRQADQARYGYRNPIINGSIFAFDRQTGKMLWSRDRHEGSVLLDQPRDAPFLILHTARPMAGNDRNRGSASVLQCIDKRTGEQFHEIARVRDGASFTIDARADHQRIDLRTATEHVRLDYGE